MPGNTLSLLFKIDADTTDAIQAFQQMSQAQRNLASSEFAGAIAEINQQLKNSKDLAQEEIDKLLGVRDALQLAKNQVDAVSAAFKASQAAQKEFITHVNQSREGLENLARGDILEGVTQLTRALGPVALGIGAVALAFEGLKLSAEAMIRTADEVGTKSKDDFDELAQSVEAAGGKLTDMDHAIAQGVNKSLEVLHGAVTDLFTELLRQAGPALINLIKAISGLLEDLKPQFAALGKLIRDQLVQLTAFIDVIRTIRAMLEADPLKALLTLDANTIFTLLDNAIKMEDKLADSTAGLASTFDTTTKKRKENLAAQAKIQADFDEQQRQAAEERQRIAIAEQQGSIDRDQRASRLVEIEERVLQARITQLNAEKDLALKSAETEDQRASIIIKANNDIANARTAAANKQSQIFAQAEKENDQEAQQLQERWDRIRRFYEQLSGEIESFWFKASQDIQKAVSKSVEVTPEGGGMAAAIEATVSASVEALDPLTRAFRELKFAVDDAASAFADNFGQQAVLAVDKLSGVVNITKTITGLMVSLGQALQVTFQNFILTGKGGAQAFRSLAAAVIASLATQAIGLALMEHAKAAAATAEAAAALAVGDFSGFLLWSLAAERHTHAAILYGIVGGAAIAVGVGIGAAGGLGGGSSAAGAVTGANASQPPNTTINVGPGGATLGQTPGQAFGTLNDNVAKLANTIDSMSPGDVVTRAASTAPGAFATGVTNATQRDASFTRRLGLTLLPSS